MCRKWRGYCHRARPDVIPRCGRVTHGRVVPVRQVVDLPLCRNGAAEGTTACVEIGLGEDWVAHATGEKRCRFYSHGAAHTVAEEVESVEMERADHSGNDACVHLNGVIEIERAIAKARPKQLDEEDPPGRNAGIANDPGIVTRRGAAQPVKEDKRNAAARKIVHPDYGARTGERNGLHVGLSVDCAA